MRRFGQAKWKPANERAPRKPDTGPAVELTPYDAQTVAVAPGLTPSRLATILSTADSGDPREQAQLCCDVIERSPKIGSALATRAAAVRGTPWYAHPADENNRLAITIAKECESLLRGAQGDDGFADDVVDWDTAIRHILRAYLPGYSLAANVWADGGRRLVGWQLLEPTTILFGQGREPRLVLEDTPQGVPLSDWGPGRWVWHRHYHASGIAKRGGLIRPAGWLHVCYSLTYHMWMRYTEKYGTPLQVATVDDEVWRTQRSQVLSILRGMATDGAAVVTRGIELKLQEPYVRSVEGYTRFLEDVRAEISMLILGQTSSSDSRDSNRSTAAAHELVRQDLREDDCRAVAATIRRCIWRPWVAWMHGPEAVALVPEMVWETDPPADSKADAETIEILNRALLASGVQVDPEEVSKQTGYKLTKVAPPPPPPPAPAPLPLSGLQHPASRIEHPEPALALAGTPSTDPTEVPVHEALQALGRDDAAPMQAWLGPVVEAVTGVMSAATPEAMREQLAKLADPQAILAIYRQMNSAAVEDAIEEAALGGHVRGIADEAARLARKEARR